MQNSNELIISMLQRRQFDSARYACLDRLKKDRLDVQAWTSLGDTMIGLKRGRMAQLCFNRALFLQPNATYLANSIEIARTANPGNDDKQVLKLLEVPSVTVSACILTRDSSRTIRQCIESLKGSVAEIIVVDTGSVDNTVEIVESLGIKVHQFEWIDDFAAARNFAHSFVTSEWAISVDSDEILYDDDKNLIRTAAGLFNDKDVLIKIVVLGPYNGTIVSGTPGRMFKASPEYRWVYPIHEIVTNGFIPELEMPVLNIRFWHDGYDASVVNYPEKLQRNLRIINQVLQNEPDNALYRFYLGRELSSLGHHDEAKIELEKALLKANETVQFDSKILSLIPEINALLNQY